MPTTISFEKNDTALSTPFESRCRRSAPAAIFDASVIKHERLLEIRMRESRCGVESFFDLFKQFDILRGHSNCFFAVPICSQVVDCRGKRGRVGDILAVKIHEPEDRLHLSYCRQTGPVCEDSKFCGIGQDTAADIKRPR